MRIVITGGDGFIARNLRVHLAERGYSDVVSVTRATREAELCDALAGADFVFHLAGINRPKHPDELDEGNRGLTEFVCARLLESGRAVPIALSSSTQAALDNAYGQSKRAAEQVIERYAAASGANAFILRLTNVFGKWSRPNYNSAVATFCHNVARGIPIMINDPAAPLRLLYVDDAVDAMIGLLDTTTTPGFIDVGPVYETTVGEVATTIESFATSRSTLVMAPVGVGLTRALYATYVSYLPPADFTYDLRSHADPRGVFVEMLKTPDCGQFSFFTAGPGITRGEHYHHTKTEKFLVVKGTARFGFRHILTNEMHEVVTHGSTPRVVETVPGWAHNITNVGEDDMIVLLWANEVFDPQRPDTVRATVGA